MEIDQQYIEQLALTLEKKEKALEKSLIPGLKEDLRGYQACLDGIHKVFLDKGMIKEDPYHYEQKNAQLKLPPTDPFPDSERQTQYSIRLSAYSEQLDFLINFFTINVNSLNLKVIKIVNGLISYVNWTDFSPNSSSLMTRITAMYLERLTQSEEQMAAKVVNSSMGILREKSHSIKRHLKQLSDYHRELYKLNVRRFVFPDLNISSDEIEFKNLQAAQKVKVGIARSGMDLPFFKELILEIFDEDYSSRAEQLRSGVLSSLHVQESTVKKKADDPEVKMRKMIMDCVKSLTITEPQLELVYSKLRDNSRIMQSQKLTFGEKLNRWFTHIFNSRKDYIEYDISYADPFTNLRKAETINFTEFLRIVQSKWTLYRNLTDSHSSSYQKAENATLDQVYEFIVKNLSDLKLIYKRLVGLDLYFKENAPPDNKGAIRGMKVEIATLKRGISSIINELNDYSAFRDEVQQLKNLGIS